jgi:oligopeptide transport system substrate-binding protein
VVWTKNANYWDAANVLPPAVEFRVIEQYDVATGVELYDNGDIDRVALSGDFVTDRQNDPDAIIVPDTSIFYLMINIANGGVTEAGPTFDVSAGDDVFDNAKIRQAIALILDKTYITDSILKNGSQAAYSLVPSNYLSSDGVTFEAARGDGYLLQDVEAGAALFAEGMAELGIEKVAAAE